MTVEMDLWKVGQPVPGAFGELLWHDDGAILEQGPDGDLNLALMLSSPNKSEIAIARKSAVEVSVITHGPFWLGMIRFAEDKQLMFDMQFDITKYPVEQQPLRIAKIKENNALFMFLIDTENGLLQSMRFMTTPNKFRESLYLAVSDPRGANFSREYESWIQEIYKKPLLELWRFGTKCGVLGEAPLGADDIMHKNY